MPNLTVLATTAAFLIGLATAVSAQPIETERVVFASGASGTVVSDTLTGTQIIDYVLGVSAGQRMVVDMAPSNASAYYNITGPGADGALHIGSSAGLHFDGVLPSGGDWMIRVYLMRNAARRGETANFDLSIHIGGAAAPTPAPDFADGNAGGPDFWEVRVTSALNIRSGPAGSTPTVGRAQNGQIFRNLGCQGAGDARWCRVEAPNGLVAGWVDGRFLVESEAPENVATTAPEVAPQFNSNAMGPDFWQVDNVASNDALNVRSGPGTNYSIVARAENGATLRNLGCRGLGDTRWCHVQTIGGGIDGWVSGAYLTEGGAPAATSPGVSIPSGSDIAPSLYLRPTGELEAQWSSGCTVLYNPAGLRITAGSSCSESQLSASDTWVAMRQ